MDQRSTAAALAVFRRNWIFLRSLTYDLLASLNDSDLLWSPGSGVGQFWKQFRHVGRVQEEYMAALQTGKIEFSPVGKSYNNGANGIALTDYLRLLDQRMFSSLENIDLDTSVDWFGQPVSLIEHLFRLDGHETLHHGQWIVYCQLRGKSFPKSWSVWGL